MRARAVLIVAFGMLLAGCGGGKAAGPAPAGAPPKAMAPASAAPKGDPACSGGLHGQEPGVVSVTCDGTATVHFEAGGASRDLHGGVCRSGGGVWSATAGVVIDVTGMHGAYTGPPVDDVTVNDTSTAGRGTIQAVVGGKHYFALGTATLTLAADHKSAKLEGTGDRQSDAPGVKITVNVTC
jgi:hypothetical protein